MADEGEKTIADLEKDAIEKFNRQLKESLDREKRMFRHYEWRGNKIPPFSIEHMPHERQRLAGSGMTDSDRMLRKQWVQDQALSPNEPRYMPELDHTHRNPIGRFLGKPWDLFESSLRPIVGNQNAKNTRVIIPKCIALAVFVWASWYNIKYHPASWEAKTGWHVYTTKPPMLPTNPSWPNEPQKDMHEFYDRGFTHRKVYND